MWNRKSHFTTTDTVLYEDVFLWLRSFAMHGRRLVVVFDRIMVKLETSGSCLISLILSNVLIVLTIIYAGGSPKPGDNQGRNGLAVTRCYGIPTVNLSRPIDDRRDLRVQFDY